MHRLFEFLDGGDPAAQAWHERMMAEHTSDYLAWREGATTAGRVFYVLGMHRSGTSCLTGCLEQCGVYVGDVERRSMHQPRGNLEQRDAIRINNTILTAGASSWREPPSGSSRAAAAEIDAITGVVRGLERHAPGALKDPRLLFTIDAWLAATGQPGIVGTFRHPIGVASSLLERDGMPRDEALRLWCRYNERLVSLHETHGFPLIEFNLADRDRYCDIATALAAQLGLAPRIGSIHRVVDQAWGRTTVAAGADVPPECAELYAYLCEHRYDGHVVPGSFTAELVAFGAEHDPRVRPTVRESLERKRSRGRRVVRRSVRTTLGPLRRAAAGLFGRPSR